MTTRFNIMYRNGAYYVSIPELHDLEVVDAASFDEMAKVLEDTLCELTACANQLASWRPRREGDSISRAQASAREILSALRADKQ